MAQPKADRVARISPRKQQLVAAAIELFQANGYDGVSMEDIAKKVGVTGPALYRHFRSKQDVLAQAVLGQITAILEAVQSAARSDGSPRERLALLTTQLGELVLDSGETMLWKWERRRLAAEDAATFRLKSRELEAATASVVRGVRADLGEPDVVFISSALLSAFWHTSSYRRGNRGPALALLGRMSHAIVSCVLPRDRDPSAFVPRHYVVQFHGRRERVIEAATELFWERGYYAVSVEDISAKADVAIATIYQYFENKASLLYAILLRGMEGLNYVTTDHLARVSNADEALQTLIRQFIDLSLGPHRRLFRIFNEEARYLPAPQQAELRGSERGHFEEWTGALRALRPGLSTVDARALTRTASGVISDIAQTAHPQDRQGIAEDLASLAIAIIHS